MTATMRAPDRRRRARKAAAEAVGDASRRLAIKMLTPLEIRYAIFGGSAAADVRAEAIGGTI